MNSADLKRAQALVAALPWRQVRQVPEGPLNQPAEPHEYVITDWPSVGADEACGSPP